MGGLLQELCAVTPPISGTNARDWVIVRDIYIAVVRSTRRTVVRLPDVLDAKCGFLEISTWPGCRAACGAARGPVPRPPLLGVCWRRRGARLQPPVALLAGAGAVRLPGRLSGDRSRPVRGSTERRGAGTLRRDRNRAIRPSSSGVCDAAIGLWALIRYGEVETAEVATTATFVGLIRRHSRWSR